MHNNEFKKAGEIAKKALSLKKEKNYEEAREKLEAGLDEFPDNNYLKASLADLYYRMDQLQQALDLAEEILADKADDPRAMTVKGNVYLKKRNYSRAREFFADAYKTEKSSYTANRLLITLYRLEEYETALDLAEEWEEKVDNPSFFRKMKAKIYEKTGDYEKADKIYDEHLQEEPEDQFAYKEKIKVRLEDKTPEEAASELKKILKIGKRDKNPHLHSLLAQKLEKAGKKEEALEEYKKTLELDPENYFAAKQAGFILHKLGESRKALNYLEDVFIHDPSDYYARSVLMNIYQKLNEEKRGIEFFREIINNNSGYNNLWGMVKKLAAHKEEDSDDKAD